MLWGLQLYDHNTHTTTHVTLPHDEEAATWLDTLTLARYGKRPGITYLCDLCVYMYILFMLARVRVFAQDLSVCERWRRAG